LNQQKFRTWIEGILSKVAKTTSGSNEILFDGYLPVSKKNYSLSNTQTIIDSLAIKFIRA